MPEGVVYEGKACCLIAQPLSKTNGEAEIPVMEVCRPCVPMVPHPHPSALCWAKQMEVMGKQTEVDVEILGATNYHKTAFGCAVWVVALSCFSAVRSLAPMCS